MTIRKKVASLAAVAILSSALATNAYASTYTVKKDDTLSSIAKKYHLSVKELKSLNKLKSDKLYIKQTLKVSKTASTASKTTTSSAKIHKVVKGDTLSGIAKKYKTTVTNIKSWNKLKSSSIKVGQKLIVSKPASKKASQEKKAAVTPKTYEYVVRSGDTLSSISKKAGMTVAQVKELNKLKSDVIYVGQKLKVYKDITKGTEPDVKDEPVQSPVIVPREYSADALVNEAKKYLGVPYKWAGVTPDGFDCSGFIWYVHNQAGKDIDRLSSEGYYDISSFVDKPVVGDLVFFKDTYKKGISHMGIYIGDNKFIHSDSSGVVITDLTNPYYKEHFESFKRLNK